MIPFYGFYSRTVGVLPKKCLEEQYQANSKNIYTAAELMLMYIYTCNKIIYHIDVTVLITWYNTQVIIRNITNIFQQRTPVRTRTIILPMMICSNVQIRLSNTISLNLLCIISILYRVVCDTAQYNKLYFTGIHYRILIYILYAYTYILSKTKYLQHH